MSETPNRSRTGAQSTADAASLDRRTFVKAAAAGTGAIAAGTSLTGSASAAIEIPRLAVDGNTFVDPEGNPVTLRGLNIVDPRRADVLAPTRGKTAVQMVEAVTSDDWGTQVIRIPMQPCDIAEQATAYCDGPVTPGSFTREELQTYCEEHVDPVVEACREAGVYCILDYHRHWTNQSTQGENEEFSGYWADVQELTLHEGLQDEVVMFWDVVAQKYADTDHALLEVYNEPTKPGMWDDPQLEAWCAERWFRWVDFIQPAVDAVREHTDLPILLGSPSWTQSPEGILLTEENTPERMRDQFRQVQDPDGNLAVTFHVYGGHQMSQNQAWNDPTVNGQGVDSVYEEYPLVVTEFGWEQGAGRTIRGTTEGFGVPFLEWMEEGVKEGAVSWTAWCADIWWNPIMFQRGFEGTDTDICNPYEDEIPQDCPEPPCEWTLTTGDDYAGDTIKTYLADYADHNNPQVPGDQQPEPEPPASPDDQWTNSVTATSIELEWSPAADATSYEVTLGGDTETTTETTYTFTGLSPETEYEIALRSVNDAGRSDPLESAVTTADQGGSDCQDSASVDGRTVCDVDGDGLYEDLNGDGNATHADVQEFFSVQHRPTWKQADKFDFNENEAVGHGDVVTLFEEVATGGL